jgi:DNA helicase-2/ATP-dependent DNA helicase PcrA
MIGENDLALISTFHGFCALFLREEAHAISWPARFQILDEQDRKSLLTKCYDALSIRSTTLTFKRATGEIRRMKHDPANDYMRLLAPGAEEELNRLRYGTTDPTLKLFFEYLHQQKKTFGFDFDDLIIVALSILKSRSDIREKWQRRLNYVMVDEFQDVSGTQYELAEMLSAYHGNLFVVGDPDQTIYSWRGANVRFLLDFAEKHPDCDTVLSDINYRSGASIIGASNTLIDRNTMRVKKSLQATRDFEDSVKYYHAKTIHEEADWIAGEIENLREAGVPSKDILILYRAHFVSRSLEAALIKRKIHYRLMSGAPFYARKEIKDAHAYLHFIAYGDDLALERIVNEPKRGAGKKTMERVRRRAEANGSSLFAALKEELRTELRQFAEMIEGLQAAYPSMLLSDLFAEVLLESGYERALRFDGDTERLDNLAELKQSIVEYETAAGEAFSLEEYLEQVALMTDADRASGKDYVRLMTVHSAKGLEARYVFVAAMNESIFPSGRTETAEEMEEERRLAYCAFTRAMDGLYITESGGTHEDGSFRYPSRFISDAGKKYVKYLVEVPEHFMNAYARRPLEPAAPQSASTDGSPSIGMSVAHPVFGRGEIVQIDERTRSCSVQFENGRTPRELTMEAVKKLLSASGD